VIFEVCLGGARGVKERRAEGCDLWRRVCIASSELTRRQSFSVELIVTVRMLQIRDVSLLYFSLRHTWTHLGTHTCDRISTPHGFCCRIRSSPLSMITDEAEVA